MTTPSITEQIEAVMYCVDPMTTRPNAAASIEDCLRAAAEVLRKVRDGELVELLDKPVPYTDGEGVKRTVIARSLK